MKVLSESIKFFTANILICIISIGCGKWVISSSPTNAEVYYKRNLKCNKPRSFYGGGFESIGTTPMTFRWYNGYYGWYVVIKDGYYPSEIFFIGFEPGERKQYYHTLTPKEKSKKDKIKGHPTKAYLAS